MVKCSKCGCDQPDYIADPTCPSGGYHNWVEHRLPVCEHCGTTLQAVAGSGGAWESPTQYHNVERCRDVLRATTRRIVEWLRTERRQYANADMFANAIERGDHLRAVR